MRKAMTKVALGFALVVSSPALAADPLRELVPLRDVFGTPGQSPGWDVAGIRCAGLIYAQESWRQDNGGSGPSKKLLDAAADGLELSVYHRTGLGQSLTTATISVEDDFHVVYALYMDRFTANDKRGHPWSGDSLLRGDQGYCKVALQ